MQCNRTQNAPVKLSGARLAAKLTQHAFLTDHMQDGTSGLLLKVRFFYVLVHAPMYLYKPPCTTRTYPYVPPCTTHTYPYALVQAPMYYSYTPLCTCTCHYVLVQAPMYLCKPPCTTRTRPMQLPQASMPTYVLVHALCARIYSHMPLSTCTRPCTRTTPCSSTRLSQAPMYLNVLAQASMYSYKPLCTLTTCMDSNKPLCIHTSPYVL
jgi:hypothetical protein